VPFVDITHEQVSMGAWQHNHILEQEQMHPYDLDHFFKEVVELELFTFSHSSSSPKVASAFVHISSSSLFL